MALQATPDHPPHGTSVLKSPWHVHRRMESPITLCTQVIFFPKRAQAIEKQAGGNELTAGKHLPGRRKTGGKRREKGEKISNYVVNDSDEHHS